MEVLGYKTKERSVVVKKLRKEGDDEEGRKAGGALMNVRNAAGEAWDRVGKRLGESPTIQARNASRGSVAQRQRVACRHQIDDRDGFARATFEDFVVSVADWGEIAGVLSTDADIERTLDAVR